MVEVENIEKEVQKKKMGNISLKPEDRVLILWEDGLKQPGVLKYTRFIDEKVKYFINRDGYAGLIGVFNNIRAKLYPEKEAPRYYRYWIEDAQFSREVELKELAGKEGEIVSIYDDHSKGKVKVYILYIKFDFVFCLGNQEAEDRVFPKNKEEHEEWKKIIKQQD